VTSFDLPHPKILALLAGHDSDSRPAWLFLNDGTRLWQNRAAAFFLAKRKKGTVKFAEPAEPIKGQVARVLRLGSDGHSTLSRIRFLAGEKPAAATCACMPLPLADGQRALLIIGVDAIDEDLLDAEPPLRGLLPGDGWQDAGAAAEEIVDAELVPVGAMEPRSDDSIGADNGEPTGEAAAAPINEPDEPKDAFENGSEGDAADEANSDAAEEDGAPEIAELSEPIGGDAADEPDNTIEPDSLELVEEEPASDPEAEPMVLYRVVARRVVREIEVVPPAAEPDIEDVVADPDFVAEPDDVATDDVDPTPPAEAVVEHDASSELDAQSVEVVDVEPEYLPADTDGPMVPEPREADERPVESPRDRETVERVSRYNFDALSRILTDRVGDLSASQAQEAERLAKAPPGSVLARTGGTAGALINLGGETLVLNRLPLGILVFRDQQVLFANRAITEMTGFESVEALREAGLAAIFPGDDTASSGPVNHLVSRNGTLIPVTARLQSISWQGRPALMLSASATEVRTGHEEAVRAFAQTMARAREDGFLLISRSGVITEADERSVALLLDRDEALRSRPLSDFVSQADVQRLRDFLERPAKFAETGRPGVRLKAAAPDAEFLLFTQGQAGVVSGYFGFVQRRHFPQPMPQLAAPSETDAGLFARISRGVRRPLNTVIGFSDLIRSAAFGRIENPRYRDYAQDIKGAGEEIAALIDELDDYAKLREGRYLPERASIDLMGLLESCVLRTRRQASVKRVIMRNAISETLPRVTADQASLTQAVLNLLASAIDQTPVGGAVVISAQETDAGGIAIHVRDNSSNGTDLSERFVVFRDGTGQDGKALAPVRSSVGLALTRSLLAVNAFSLSVDPAGERGMLFTMVIPADLVDRRPAP
jgi:signal transduction histidine kinase